MRPHFGQTKIAPRVRISARGGIVTHPPTAVDGVVAGLRARILAGTLQPGTSLPPERELAGQLAVSRATLREGLSILSQMGLLAIHRGRAGGAVVTAPPTTIVSSSIALLFQTRAVTAGQLCEFRRALEVEAAQLAAMRRSRQDLEEIATALDAYVASGKDTVAQNLHGRAFHNAVARASGNPLLAETMTSLNDAFAVCFYLQHTARAPDPAQLIHELHWPIFDAIRHQDESSARHAMLVHFAQLQNALSDLGISDHTIGNQIEGDHAASADTTGSPRRQPAPVAGRG
jgi:GntR family transcriptional regulator, transcriptional repressor for pyruvate dehydrogenase complex